MVASFFVNELKDGAAYLEAFLMVLRNVTKEETVQYVMALIDEMLAGLLHARAVSANLNRRCLPS